MEKMTLAAFLLGSSGNSAVWIHPRLVIVLYDSMHTAYERKSGKELAHGYDNAVLDTLVSRGYARDAEGEVFDGYY